VPRLVGSLRLRALDVADVVAGRRDALTPPRRLQHRVGPSGFVATGEEFLGHLIELCGLRPEHRVLDAGCGVGRLARPLAAYLRGEGSYDGFDLDAEALSWCRRRYRDRERFRFLMLDARRPLPFGEGEYDVAVAASLLTHLQRADQRTLLGELRRVLAPGGRALVTALVLGDPARVPETGVAVAEDRLLAAVAEAGFALEVLHRGTWSGGEGRSLHDLAVLAC